MMDESMTTRKEGGKMSVAIVKIGKNLVKKDSNGTPESELDKNWISGVRPCEQGPPWKQIGENVAHL